MANTARTRAVESAMAAAQALNPRNLDDALIILRYAGDYDTATVRVAREVVEAHLDGQQ